MSTQIFNSKIVFSDLPLFNCDHYHFCRYLDRYRCVKDIQEEVLKERLKEVDPLSPPRPDPKYPNLHPLQGYAPSWLKTRVRNMRLRRHQWKDLKPEI